MCLGTTLSSCKKDQEDETPTEQTVLNGAIDLGNLPNYANQELPRYINRDNTGSNRITDVGATLGRVLFYDKNLSATNTISCASCHQQQFAFGDVAQLSQGANGITGRHSMRLVNARFGDEARFFWDERTATLEAQSTMPIQDHNEMGYSGANGDLSMDDLLIKLAALAYYPTLFEHAFGSPEITEARMQLALAQFVRSIQSFDSKYDRGLQMARNDRQDFENFTAAENAGKRLFLDPPQAGPNGQRVGGGAGCAGCHQPPEFSIDPNSGNNGVVAAADGNGQDIDVTRSPTLRDLVGPDGQLNGQMMHTGNFNMQAMLAHYNNVPNAPGLDPRLRPGGALQQLNLSQQEFAQLEAFLRTLTGSDVYTNQKWSDPFAQQGLAMRE